MKTTNQATNRRRNRLSVISQISILSRKTNMRTKALITVLLLIGMCSSAQTAMAVPRTGFGPGGFEDDADGIVGTNGSALVLWFCSDRRVYQNLAGTIAATA